MTAANYPSKLKSLFSHPNIGSFFQVAPKLSNPYQNDGFLQRILQRTLPLEIQGEVSADLTRFGDRIVNELEPLGNQCEVQGPTLNQFNAWGHRVDEIVTCDAWKRIKDISAEEGVIAIGYERKYREFSRLVQFAKLFLYQPSSGLFSCPIAASDGAAKTIETLGIIKCEKAFKRITSRDPKEFWTSGQWMTERRGGSDVSGSTETIALKQSDGSYRLYGYKFFCSTTDSEMTLTLGRIVDEKSGEITQGSAGLSLFYVEARVYYYTDPNGPLNGIQIMKLKNKLGTRQLPTAELLLDGCKAYLGSKPGKGISAISNMLTVTRIHNASASVSFMRRILSLSRDYSERRTSFGNKLSNYPLHVNTLGQMELETRGGMILLFEMARCLGITEFQVDLHKKSSEEQHLLRLLTPIVKLYTGKRCIGVISEGLESFGGQGYIEDTHLPKILRDAQITPIWEGTTNILSLDVLRALAKSKGESLLVLKENLQKRLIDSISAQPTLTESANKILRAFDEIIEESPKVTEVCAREFALAIGDVTIGALLIEHAAFSGASQCDILTAKRWANEKVTSFKNKMAILQEDARDQDSYHLVFDSYEENQD